MAAIDRDKVEREWSARGFSCGVWIDPPGRVWSDFVHDTDEIVMLLEGEQEFEFGGKNFRLKPGEEMLIPAGTRHAARNVGGVTSKWLYGYKGK
jgi:cupin 2 domain-containing protein